MSAPTVPSPTAAGSGRNATERFAQKERSAATVDQARVSAIATDAITALHEVIRRHQVTYDEYDQILARLPDLPELRERLEAAIEAELAVTGV